MIAEGQGTRRAVVFKQEKRKKKQIKHQMHNYGNRYVIRLEIQKTGFTLFGYKLYLMLCECYELIYYFYINEKTKMLPQ